MNQLTKIFAALLVVGVAGNAEAAKFKFSGDLNNRVNIYTDQANLYGGSETITGAGRTTTDATDESWADIKYRLTSEMASDDGVVKGVYGIEIGAFRFGKAPGGAIGSAGPVNGLGGGSGGGYSGDGVNVETRFAYIDFGLGGGGKNRLSFGLQPFTVNKYLWQETATAIQYKATVGPGSLTLAWARGNELFNNAPQQRIFRDADNLLARFDFTPMKDTKVGLFGLYQRSAPEAATGTRSHLLKGYSGVDYDIYNIGLDGALKFANGVFVNFDAIYQGGESVTPGATGTDLDVQAFFVHADLGVNIGKTRVTYTGWFASGDDNATDRDQKNFTATDVDIFDSIVLFEGGYADDNYFTEAPYFLTFGAIFNRLGIDFRASDKLTLGIAGMYIMAAEDIGTTGSKNIGLEFDGAVSYKLTKELELAVNAGYLIADDGFAAFAAPGTTEQDVFRTTARARYIF